MKDVVRFGICADVQYASMKSDVVKEKRCENVGSGEEQEIPRGGSVERRLAYRAALERLLQAVEVWNKQHVAFVVQLGDLIDGYENDPELSRADLEAVSRAFQGLAVKHVLGNHCRAVRMEDIRKLLSTDRYYYSFQPVLGWRIIVLNGAEQLISAADATESENAELAEVLERQGIIDYAPWNGHLSDIQVDFFRVELDSASRRKERVLVCCHYPIHEDAARKSHLLINHAVVLKLVRQYNTTVVALFAGHDHVGGYTVDHGVHHVTFPAMLEASEGSDGQEQNVEHSPNAFGIVELRANGDRILIQGYGDVPTRVLVAGGAEG
ncbi:Manganese-dependent ADP-ribose/CDP-alcohol diphosphatase [Porphyridium purpureum]|uniref:Manganese-dependent ADP-ribose/CDP-alcohol diphosphatase n=1 Tax=Porphyridium purpureum TaxID=35688 RepID=A0A5J4YGB9_PORPP|nr:Manganese-dependent ADP-ribose/CDP-alcohol diphosphatase [Porphyridium purpureum]|eukprot:POR9670..scf250_33